MQMEVNDSNYLDYIIKYESGELQDNEMFALFQYLYNTGLYKELQGSYWRTTQRLLEEGLIKKDE